MQFLLIIFLEKDIFLNLLSATKTACQFKGNLDFNNNAKRFITLFSKEKFATHINQLSSNLVRVRIKINDSNFSIFSIL